MFEIELSELIDQFKEDLGIIEIVLVWLFMRLNTQVLKPLRAFLLSLKQALDRKDFSHENLEEEIAKLRRVIRSNAFPGQTPEVRSSIPDTERMRVPRNQG